LEGIMQHDDYLILPNLIPDPDTIRRRLAVAVTEADLLRSQLRVSERLSHERERLRGQRPVEMRHAAG
jgi:precorrin-6B methylase 1